MQPKPCNNYKYDSNTDRPVLSLTCTSYKQTVLPLTYNSYKQTVPPLTCNSYKQTCAAIKLEQLQTDLLHTETGAVSDS